jgi:glutathione reductase (NADPH)
MRDRRRAFSWPEFPLCTRLDVEPRLSARASGVQGDADRMADFEFDFFVIGAGSGGVRAARIAAGHGARVAIAENSRFGGTCVIRGCVPKKLYVMASRYADDFEDARGFGWSVGETKFDWSRLVAAKEREITRLEGLYRTNLDKSGVAIFPLRATLAGPQTVSLSDGRALRARQILVATGGAPSLAPQVPGIELALTSNEIFDLPVFPRRLLILGAGYIAVEFAALFARLGAKVALCYRADLPLRGFDEDLRSRLAAALAEAGIELFPLAKLASLEKTGAALRAQFEDGGSLEADVVMAATGRRPATAGLGLEAAGVRLSQHGAIVVGAASQSSVASIHAVGDVTDRLNLTPVAIREGHALADRLFGKGAPPVDYDFTPTAVFSTPEIGSVGLTEEEAARCFGALDIYEAEFRPMQAPLTGRATKAYMKLIVAADGGRVLGAHLLGPQAAEMAQLLALALRMGATKADFDATMALHPTLAEELVTMRTVSRKRGA